MDKVPINQTSAPSNNICISLPLQAPLTKVALPPCTKAFASCSETLWILEVFFVINVSYCSIHEKEDNRKTKKRKKEILECRDSLQFDLSCFKTQQTKTNK